MKLWQFFIICAFLSQIMANTAQKPIEGASGAVLAAILFALGGMAGWRELERHRKDKL